MASDPSPNLNQVQRDLQRHRRDFSRRRIPDTLRRRVLDLLPVYPRKQVINTLGISYKMLRSWERDQAASLPAFPVTSPAMDFVSIPVPEEMKTIFPVTTPSEGPSVQTEVAVAALELRFDADTVLTFAGASASTHCLQLLRGLGYGRRHLSDAST